MKWTQKCHEFDKIAEKLLKSETTYRLWGAAQLGKDFCEKLGNKFKIVQIVDGDSNKHGQQLNDIEIESPDSLIYDENSIVVVTCSYYDENRPQIEKLGYTHMKSMFYYEDFYILYDLYTSNYLKSKRVDFSLTEKCTLKCKKCNMFMTHFKNPQNQLVEDVIGDIDAYFSVVDYVKVLNLLGGEPFLYPELKKVLDYITEYYRNRIGQVIIFTNGTIVPGIDVLESIKKCSAIVQFSDYTHVVPYEKKLTEFRRVLESYGIEQYTMPWESWGDFGFPENPNTITEDTKALEFFEQCKAPFRGVWKNRVYFCHLETSAVRAGIYTDDKNDYFELQQSDEVDVKKMFCEFDYGYSDKGFITFCKVCRGCDCVNDLTVPIAEQC